MKKVFIDGKEGTTGLRIYERLAERKNIQLITLPEEERKDAEARKRAICQSDIVFLCLPDAAAKESVELAKGSDAVIIDTSTAHRVNPDFAYGFPELSSEFYGKIKSSKRIAVPGCHASGFIALVYPLIDEGLIDVNTQFCCTSVTGYSGGGKKMIAEYGESGRDVSLSSPRQYGITQEHKHLKDMVGITGLRQPPAFMPIVADFYSGMTVTVPLFKSALKKGCGIEDVKKIYKNRYTGPIVKYRDKIDKNGFVDTNTLSGFDSMEISVMGNEDRIILCATYDNLGKGASGAAIECMNIVMGENETRGLNIKD